MNFDSTILSQYCMFLVERNYSHFGRSLFPTFAHPPTPHYAVWGGARNESSEVSNEASEQREPKFNRDYVIELPLQTRPERLVRNRSLHLIILFLGRVVCVVLWWKPSFSFYDKDSLHFIILQIIDLLQVLKTSHACTQLLISTHQFLKSNMKKYNMGSDKILFWVTVG